MMRFGHELLKGLRVQLDKAYLFSDLLSGLGREEEDYE